MVEGFMRNKPIAFLIEVFLLCILLLCMYGNFCLSAITTDYVIKLLNFIAFEWFGKERFYIYARGIGTGLYHAGSVVIGLFAMSLYSLFAIGCIANIKA